MSEQLLVRLTKRNSSREMYSPIQRHIDNEKHERFRHFVFVFRIYFRLDLDLDSKNWFASTSCPSSFFLLLLLFSIPLLTPEEDQRLKALVFFIFFMCRHVGEYISLELSR